MFSVSQYQQLRPAERMTIAAMKLQGASTRTMAKLLGRSPSTISRELRRNVDDQGGYDSHRVVAFSVLRRREGRPQGKLDPRGVAWGVVLTLLSWKWAPQQIAATLQRVFPDDPCRHVSHETIYTAIYALPRGELKRDLLACLRQGKSVRMPRSRGTDRRAQSHLTSRTERFSWLASRPRRLIRAGNLNSLFGVNYPPVERAKFSAHAV